MTTRHSFFFKVFEEGEKAKPLYDNYDFKTFSPQKIYLLEKLSIISKYKDYLKQFLLKKKITDRDKFDYITHYKASMSYSEYIKFNVMVEENENNFINTLYVIGGLNLFLVMFFIVRRPPNIPIVKEIALSSLFSLISGFAFYRYCKTDYKKSLDEIYTEVERRLNLFPDMKMSSFNMNYVSEENYDEDTDDRM